MVTMMIIHNFSFSLLVAVGRGHTTPAVKIEMITSYHIISHIFISSHNSSHHPSSHIFLGDEFIFEININS